MDRVYARTSAMSTRAGDRASRRLGPAFSIDPTHHFACGHVDKIVDIDRQARSPVVHAQVSQLGAVWMPVFERTPEAVPASQGQLALDRFRR
jgi:hypothetical protein